MKEITFLVLLALLFISGEARPKDEVGLEPVSPLPTFAASNDTEIKTPKPPRRFIAEGYGKRSVPDEGDPEETQESEVQVGPVGIDVVLKKDTESAGETKTKISFSRDRRSPQDQDSTSEVDNEKSSEEDNTTVVIAIARPQRPGLFVAPEVGDAEKEEKPEVAGKEPTDVATDSEADTSSSRSRRIPQSNDGACDDDDDKSSHEDTSEDSTTAAIPIVRPSRPLFHRIPTEGTPRKEETTDTEGIDQSVQESTDETINSTEDTSTLRYKRHPQSKDDTDEVDEDKSSEDDTQDETPAVASPTIGSPLRPILRRPVEANKEDATVGNDKQDRESDVDTSASSEETITETAFSRKKRSPQKNEGSDKNSKDTKNETTAPTTTTRPPRPAQRRPTVGGGVTGKPATHLRATPTPPSRIPSHTPINKTPTSTPVTRRPTPSHVSNTPSN